MNTNNKQLDTPSPPTEIINNNFYEKKYKYKTLYEAFK